MKAKSRVIMSKIEFKLRGYQVGSKLPMLRPSGHLFVEYSLAGSDEEAWVSRGEPMLFLPQLVVNVEHNPESDSRDSLKRILHKNPITLRYCLLEAEYSFNQFVDELEDLRKAVKETMTGYGLFFDNSNSVASLAWKCVTRQELVLSGVSTGCIFAGIQSKRIELRMNKKYGFQKYKLWYNLLNVTNSPRNWSMKMTGEEKIQFPRGYEKSIRKRLGLGNRQHVDIDSVLESAKVHRYKWKRWTGEHHIFSSSGYYSIYTGASKGGWYTQNFELAVDNDGSITHIIESRGYPPDFGVNEFFARLFRLRTKTNPNQVMNEEFLEGAKSLPTTKKLRSGTY